MHYVSPQILEELSEGYEDWTGVASAEDSTIAESNDLYELAGLNRDEWTIMGIEASTYSHGDPSRWQIRVYAYNRKENPANSPEGLRALAEKEEDVPVVDILLHEVGLEDLVRCMKWIGFRLVNPNFPSLKRVARGDYPEQN